MLRRLRLHLIYNLILSRWLTPSLLMMRTRLLELMMTRFVLHVEHGWSILDANGYHSFLRESLRVGLRRNWRTRIGTSLLLLLVKLLRLLRLRPLLNRLLFLLSLLPLHWLLLGLCLLNRRVNRR